ncbi:MAG: c-type cytochrome [Gallionellaceae bacterium]|nr:c-type cytochrome [Gallionellaceae bacterium]
MKPIIVSLFALASLMMASGAWAVDMPALAKKNNCTACHAIDKKLVGPAWMEVAKKYKGVTKYTYSGKEYGLEEGLIVKVSKGGAGVWGSMPMPANVPAVSAADIKELVKFILDLAK